jgi:hypothetical protein
MMVRRADLTAPMAAKHLPLLKKASSPGPPRVQPKHGPTRITRNTIIDGLPPGPFRDALLDHMKTPPEESAR